MPQSTALRVALAMAVCLAACHCRFLKEEETLDEKLAAFCEHWGEGDHPNILTSDTPLCSTSYIHCDLNGTNAIIEDGLGMIITQNNNTVPAVFNAFSSTPGATLPGALGTLNCNCTEFYTEDEDVDYLASCMVCDKLQLEGVCNVTQVIYDQTFSCAASIKELPGVYFNCGLGGSFIQNGTVVVDKTTRQIVVGALTDDE